MSRKRNKKQKIWQYIVSSIIIICIIVFEYMNSNIENANKINENNLENTIQTGGILFDLSTIPEYSSSPYVEINNNMPYFEEEDYTTKSFEKYSEWDELGRSGVAFANICKEIMPGTDEERGEIGSIKNLSRMGSKKI